MDSILIEQCQKRSLLEAAWWSPFAVLRLETSSPHRSPLGYSGPLLLHELRKWVFPPVSAFPSPDGWKTSFRKLKGRSRSSSNAAFQISRISGEHLKILSQPWILATDFTTASLCIRFFDLVKCMLQHTCSTCLISTCIEDKYAYKSNNCRHNWPTLVNDICSFYDSCIFPTYL